MTISQAAEHILKQLSPLYKEQEASMIPWWILSFVTSKSVNELLTNKQTPLNPTQLEHISEIIHQHTIEHKPLQYIFGSVPFLNLDIAVRPPILIPRPETEYWCSWIIKQLKHLKNQQLTILDMCTGTGALALALAQTFPQAIVYAVDISKEACKLARENAQKNKVSNVTIIESDLFTALPELKFDLIVSNPPYISAAEYQNLDESVKKWEDPKALLADNDGLALIETIINQTLLHLKGDNEMLELSVPELVIEIGHLQGPAVVNLFKTAGFSDVAIHKDQAGKDRFVTGRYTKITYEQI